MPGTPIRVRRPAATPLVVVGSRSHRGDSLDSVLARLGPHEMRPMGSSLKICLVAEGSADFYPRLGPTSEWDTAAAQAVVEAAGGAVTTLDGKPLRYNERDTLLNPHFLAFGDPAREFASPLLSGAAWNSPGKRCCCCSRCWRWSRSGTAPSRRVRRPMTQPAKPARSPGAALLDGTVAFRSLRVVRGEAGRPQFERTYLFDYSTDGTTRRQGFVVVTGRHVESIGLQ